MKFSFQKLYIKFSFVLFAVLILFNIGFLTVPLISQFGYENSAANSFLIFIITVLYSIHYFRKENESGIKPLFFFKHSRFVLGAFILIPFMFAFVSTLLFSRCPLTDGMLFFVILVIPSIYLGFVSGYFSFALSKKYSYLFFFIILFFLLIISLSEFYFNPQIYFYNPVVGYIPGTIYDEDLEVNGILLVYRLFNIVIGTVLIYASYKVVNKNKIIKIGFLFFALLAAIMLYFLKPSLGFATNAARLEKKLTNKIETEHFVINYSKPKDDFLDPMLIGLMHEYYYEQIEDELQIRGDEKICSFIFSNPQQKKELFGAGNANVAKPWLNQIYLNYDTYDVSLKHELVHVLAGQFGVTPFKVAHNINPAMIEGIAMAVENNFDDHSIHFAAKLAYQTGYKITIRSLFSGLNFFSQYSTISYLYSGSFIKYLIDVYGIENVKTLYADTDFKKVIGKNINELEKEYFSFLDSSKIGFNKNSAQLYFAGQPIFKKYCPRSAASQTKKADNSFNNKEFQKAYELFSEVYSYSDSYPSLRGKINSLIKLDRTAEAEDILIKELNKFKTSRYYFYLELMLADLHIRNGNFTNALSLYDSLLTQSPHIDYVNNVLTKKEFFREGVDSLKKYIVSETKGKFQMLTRLNNKTIKYFTIPALLNMCSDSNEVRKICNDFKNIMVTDYNSSYASLILSRAAVSLKDFRLAKNFAIKSLAYKDNKEFVFTLSQNLRMINWFFNFSDEIKPFFVYK